MTPENFIVSAYLLTGLLLAILCLATWLRARRVRAQLAQRDAHEA